VPLRPSSCDAPDDLRRGFNYFPDYMLKPSDPREVFSFPEDLSYARQLARLIRTPLSRAGSSIA
jgi:hypothetical protein